ncbi:MAG: hypothetical protein KGL52_01170 [Rhodospirillales bacterium]|nr:hypothetical protein [Rhodospirillales bacterium]
MATANATTTATVDADPHGLHAASVAHGSAIDRLHAAEAAVPTAAANLSLAIQNAENAGADDDPQALIDAVTAGEMAVRRAEIALKVAESQLRASGKKVLAAQHAASKPEADKGWALRKELCAEMDALREQMNALFQKFAQATLMIMNARKNGYILPCDPTMLAVVVPANGSPAALGIPSLASETALQADWS